MRLSFVLFIVLNSTFIACAQNNVTASLPERISAVENNLGTWVKIDDKGWNLQDRMAFHKIHGVTVAVIKDYKIDWAKGYGLADTSDKRPVTTQTLFQAASISKSLNAVGLLLLADQKKIDIHKDINTYLKSWKFPYDSLSKNKPVTTAHLLSHTGGLSVHGFPGYKWTDSLPSDNDILDGKRPANTKAVRSEFEPGLRSKYSGGGTTVSKKILMDVVGQPYDIFMQKNVLDPLGMKSSFYTQPPPPGSFTQLATAYGFTGQPVTGKFHIYPEQAADGLWTNPTDLAHYIIEMQLAIQGKSKKVLSKEMATTMLTPYVDKEAALGVFINKRGDRSYFGHGGANNGFRCQYYASLDGGDGVVVMVNSDNGAILNEIINSVATVYGWKEYYVPKRKTIIKVPSEILDTYAGTYNMQNGSTLRISRNGEDLFIQQNDFPAVKLYFTSSSEFFIYEAVNAEAQFLKKPDSTIEAIVIKQGGREEKAMRK